MKEKEEAEENKCNNSGGTEERNGGTERSTVDTMSVLIYIMVRGILMMMTLIIILPAPDSQSLDVVENFDMVI